MKQLALDLGDDEPTQERVTFTVFFTDSTDLNLDPREFRGKSVPAITEEIKAVLRSIAPHADFFEQDIVHAADYLHAASSRD